MFIKVHNIFLWPRTTLAYGDHWPLFIAVFFFSSSLSEPSHCCCGFRDLPLCLKRLGSSQRRADILLWPNQRHFLPFMGPRQDRRFTREGGRRKTELGQKLVPVGVVEGESGGGGVRYRCHDGTTGTCVFWYTAVVHGSVYDDVVVTDMNPHLSRRNPACLSLSPPRRHLSP